MSIDVSKPDDLPDRGLAEARGKHDAPRGLSVKCPECGSERVWRNGFRRFPNGERVQTYICADCYRKFTDPSNSLRQTMETKSLSSVNRYPTSREEDLGSAGSRSDMGGGLVLEKPLEARERPAGGTDTSQGLLASFGLWLLKQGKSERTVKNYIEYLRMLMSRGADLMDPERPFFPWVC